MQVRLNTDNRIEGRESLERWASTELSARLDHFRADLTHIEVHLSDEGSKGGAHKRCAMEARLASHPPVAVSQQAPSVDEAFRGAMDKLHHALDAALGKRKDHRDRDTIRRDLDAGTPSA